VLQGHQPVSLKALQGIQTFDWTYFLRRRTIISFIPLVLQQMSGLILYLGYSAYFFSLVSEPKFGDLTVAELTTPRSDTPSHSRPESSSRVSCSSSSY
jgi:hypothetical protein